MHAWDTVHRLTPALKGRQRRAKLRRDQTGRNATGSIAQAFLVQVELLPFTGTFRILPPQGSPRCRQKPVLKTWESCGNRELHQNGKTQK